MTPDIGDRRYLKTAATKSCPALSWWQVAQNITLTLMIVSLIVKKKKKKGYNWHHWWIHSGLLIHGRVCMMVLTGDGPSMDELGKVRIVFNVQYVLCTHNHPAPFVVSEVSVYHWAAQINCCKAVSSETTHPSSSNPPQMRVVATLLYFNLLFY